MDTSDQYKSLYSSAENDLHKYTLNMSVKDVAEFLGFCENTVHSLIKKGELPVVNLSTRKKIIHKNAFIDWYIKLLIP